ncbi:hypothetical protein LguiB_014638 [Lonicera macranthoides]
MFGFSRRRTKLGRLKIHLSDSAQGTRSPIRHPKRTNNSNGEGGIAPAVSDSDELKCQCSSTEPEVNTGNGENWMELSITGDKPTPRFNHAAAVIGNKMVVVGGESGNGLLEDVQVLNLDGFSWTTSSSKLYLSPTRLPLKVPACKGHSLISWGKKVLLIGGKTDPATERISVWAFDTESECWSLLEAKGDIPVARSGHTVVRATSFLILFGGEDAKRRKLNDLHMFDLKTLTWLPLRCTTGPGPSARSNHVAALYDDKLLLIFGGTSKSRTLNDLYSFDFETMIWSRIKTRGFHPLPRAGSCGVLCGTKWYIAGGGSRKKRHAETLIFDIVKLEWSVVASTSTSVITNKGFSLVVVQQKERDLLLAFGGSKKEPSNQVEALTMEKNELSMGRRSTPGKGLGPLLSESSSSMGPTKQPSNGSLHGTVDSVGRQNLASAVENHGSGRRSLSESLLVDPSHGNLSLRKQLHNEEDNSMTVKVAKSSEDGNSSQTRKQVNIGIQNNSGGHKISSEEMPVFEPEKSDKEGNANLSQDGDDVVLFQESDVKSSGLFSAPSSIYRLYETKVASLIKKNGILEGQLAAASASREAAEKNLSNVLKSRQEMERKLADTVKEMEFLREKLVAEELAKEEANSLSNIVHSDNVRLEHDVAFLKAVLDDTQKELHSTRGVLAGERARAFQLQVEVFHLKQRMQSMETQAPTPRKPYHV